MKTNLYDEKNARKQVAEALKEGFETEVAGKKLTLESIDFEDKYGDDVDWNSIKDAVIDNKTIGAKIKGTFDLSKDGKSVAKKKMTLGTIPKLTNNLNSFLINGVFYDGHLQQRLRAGSYPRETERGEIEIFNNVNNSRPFRTIIEPKDEILKLRIGQAHIPMYPILRTLGISDSNMSNKIGKEILAKNQDVPYESSIKRAYKSIYREKPETLLEAEKGIREHFEGITTDPKINKKLLGEEHSVADGEYLLSTAGKLVRILKGKDTTANRDALQFKDIYNAEDFLGEGVANHLKRYSVQNKRMAKMKSTDDIEKIVNNNALKKSIEQSLTLSPIVQYSPQVNPIAILNNSKKTTLLGPGGIGGPHIVPKTAKQLQNSYIGLLDPTHTPTSRSAGISLYLAEDAKKDGKDLKSKVVNLRTGKTEWVTAEDMQNEGVALPGEFENKSGSWKPKNDKIHMVQDDKMKVVDFDIPKYAIPEAHGLFDISSNMVPFYHSNQGNRGVMSAKGEEQAVNLTDGELPLVDVKVGDKLISEQIGEKFSIKAKVGGKVAKVNKKEIVIKSKSGKKHKYQIFNDIPLNDASYLDSKVKVSVGDTVKKGDLLADSNFTQDGKYTYGTNLTTAFMPYKGHTFEDGVVITDRAADKLKSTHIEKVNIPLTENTVVDFNKYKAYSPYGIKKSQWENYDDDGTISVGKKVRKGDPLFAGLKENVLTGADSFLQKLKKSAVKPYKDNTISWDGDDEGEITDKKINRDSVDIYVKTTKKFKEGDKIVGRHGNKGIVSKIIKEENAPVTASGEKVELIIDPHSVPSRINPGQILENAAGKLADRTGKPYIVENFSGKNYLDDIKRKLKENNIDEKEDLFDPIEGITIPKVAVGKSYITKLPQQVSKKLSARGLSGNYTQNEQPTRGGGAGGQSVGRLAMNAFLGYNARNLLEEAYSVKNNRNNAYWRAVQNGEIPPMPEGSFENEKLLALMKQMGVNVKDNGTTLKLSPLTDKDVEELSIGKIPNPTKLFRGKGVNLKAIKGGLFGEEAGGFRGNSFSHIELGDRIVNPAYEDAVKTLLGVTKKEYEEML